MIRAPRVLSLLALLPLAALTPACAGGDGGGDATARAGAAAHEEPLTAATVDPAVFDSISWPTPRDALSRGGTVYAYSCAKCHGDSGAGNGGYRLNGKLLRPPSFLEAGWRFGNDLTGLRATIYSGTDRGMPHWGRAGLPPRDVDAVARYVTRLWARAD